MHPGPHPQPGNLKTLHIVPGVWEVRQSLTSINSILPDGTASVPMADNMEKDPDLGVIWGNHPKMSSDEKHKSKELISRKKDAAFAYSVADLGTYTGDIGPFKISLRHGQPLLAKRRPKSRLEAEILDEKCNELKAAGLIEPAPTDCKYASECVLPVKKDANGEYTDRRFCVDYRPINEATEPDKYGLHRPDQIFKSIQGHKVFSKIDLRAGFHQIPVNPADKPKTAFWWNNQIWQYLKMPFGARNATAHFQRMMDDEIIQSGLQGNVASFVDDILVYSKTVKEHLVHMEKVLQMLEGCGLKAHPDKTVVCAATVEFLGHNVSEYGLLPNEAKVAAIRALQPPTNVSTLRSVLGFIGYYRCYIPNYSALAAPMNKLLSKNIPWEWGAEQQVSFDTLKAEVCVEGKVLRHQDPTKPLILHTDWSNVGIGAVLGQIDDSGSEYMVACISRSLNVHERNYSSPQGEMLAAVWAVKTFHTYLHGCEFTLVTDHQPLTYLMSKPDLVGLHARWAITLQQYTFNVVHRPGVQHQNADCLSRTPAASTEDVSGARLHDDNTPTRSMMSLQMCTLQSANSHQRLEALHDLHHVADFFATFTPHCTDLISQANDTDEPRDLHLCCIFVPFMPTLLHNNMRVDDGDYSKGGVEPKLAAAFFAANTTIPPAGFLQQTELQAADAQERYSGPSDVWEDAPVMKYLTQGSVEVGLPAHECRRVYRRASAFVRKEGVIYRVFKDGICKEVPPPDKREALVKEMHEKMGHFGTKRTSALLFLTYYWHGMSKDVREVVSKCGLCDRVNTSFNAAPKQLTPLPVMGLFYRWGVDLAGPLNPTSSTGNRYVMVLVEHFSKHVEAVPIADKCAATTAQVFAEVVLCKFGSCAEVITDGGTEFSGEFDEVLKMSLIDHRNTAPNHPQADGLAERAVQTIK